jgi:hypothetical protein
MDNQMISANHIIQSLDLKPHPEGGYFKENYRSEGVISKASLGPVFPEKRNFSTAIYFLLRSGEFSAFHRIRQDEIWHHYMGTTIVLHMIDQKGNYSSQKVGKKLQNDEVPQFVVPGGVWFAAEILEENAYALLGCTVSPGFDFQDFEMPSGSQLINQYPRHKEILERLTR